MSTELKIISWNVNGLRSIIRQGFWDWLKAESPDMLCLQEIKCTEDQVPMLDFKAFGYNTYVHSAQKPGYSGVAVFTKRSPKRVAIGLGHSSIDVEGRVLELDFGNFILVNAYFPNSQRDHARLGFKLEFCDQILAHLKKLVDDGRHVILCGDYNIAHREIDLANPKTNTKTAGFLPEERAWMDKFLNAGFSDVFRAFEPDGGHYSWWSYRPGVRSRNIGWRIDYHCVNKGFSDSIIEAKIFPGVMGSDHCPVGVKVKHS
jgi:exodeoxyribonuclease-3